MDKKFKRSCPECSKDVFHTSKHNRNAAEKKKKPCRSCSLIKFKDKSLSRNCPKCNTLINYKRVADRRHGDSTNALCRKCSTEPVQFKEGEGSLIKAEHTIPKYNLDFLRNRTPQSLYFLGLIIADGSFYGNSFEITLKYEDKYILELLGKLAGGCKVDTRVIKENKYSRLSFNNKESIKEIKKLFGFKKRKTYNPIDFTLFKNFTKEELLSILVGIIDGDGCTYLDKNHKNPNITITYHPTWSDFYKDFFKKLDIYCSVLKKDNIETSSINRTKSVLLINKHIKDNDITILNRKWDKFENLKLNEKIRNSYRNIQ